MTSLEQMVCTHSSFRKFVIHGIVDEDLAVLQKGCFKYFECGGECIRGPVSLLSG